MRVLIPIIVATWASAAALGSNYRDVQRAVQDDQMLQVAGVTPAEVAVRKQCSAAVVETDDPPDFFDCVYVQTGHDLNLFSLEDGFLMSELQLTMANIDGVALQHMGKYSQVQIFSRNRVAALFIHDNSWIDVKQTRAVYQWLLEHGARSRDPVKWIGP
jgi:hypothetical protein